MLARDVLVRLDSRAFDVFCVEPQHLGLVMSTWTAARDVFFVEVCDAPAGVTDVLVVGSHTAQAQFRHYVDKHRPALAKQIVGWQTVDHPSDGQLLALAREYFIQQGGMARTQTRI